MQWVFQFPLCVYNFKHGQFLNSVPLLGLGYFMLYQLLGSFGTHFKWGIGFLSLTKFLLTVPPPDCNDCINIFVKGKLHPPSLKSA